MDVGANVGTLTLPMARKLGAEGWLYAFEPVPTTYWQLCGTIALNSLVNVEPVRAVVGDTAGEMLVADLLRHQHRTGRLESGSNNYGALGAGAWQELASIADIRTPMIRLDDFLDIPSLALMKVDVEGMELNVLRGASALIQQHRPCIYAENDRQECSRPLIEFLWAAGYQVYWHTPLLFPPGTVADCAQKISLNVLAVPEHRQDLRVDMQKIVDAREFPEIISPDGVQCRILETAAEPQAEPLDE